MSKDEILVIGKTVQFNTYGNIENINTFKGEVIGIFSGRDHPLPATALAQHTNIYPSLPEAVQIITPNDYRQYRYATVLTETGAKYRIGFPWIIDSSLSIVTERSAAITLTNVTDADGERIRKVLTQAGYDVSAVEFITG